ncbi:MAG: hypothetical protein ABGZ17_26760 [Planctomycetaceae bacterium]
MASSCNLARFLVSLGEVPVNDFFWRALSRVDSPMAFTAGMSLTFEQANLDHARYYQAAFARVGDARTATLSRQGRSEDELRLYRLNPAGPFYRGNQQGILSILHLVSWNFAIRRERPGIMISPPGLPSRNRP